jgi:signal peptide peptidase SppA
MKNNHALMSLICRRPMLIGPGWLEYLIEGRTAGLPPKLQQRIDAEPPDTPVIALIPVYNALTYRPSDLDFWFEEGTSYMEIRRRFRKALFDDAVTSIVFVFDTPGGEGAGCFDLVDEIYNARGTKPIIAVVNHLALSGGYALASACDRIIAPRLSQLGSIGAVAVHRDLSGSDAQIGVKYEYIYSGARKIDGSPHNPLSTEARDAVQEMVDGIRDLFAGTVARNRGMTKEAVLATEAAVYDAEHAVAAGLADAVGTLEEALTEALSMGPKTRKESNKMYKTLAELEAACPDLVSQIREAAVSGVDTQSAIDAAVAAERARITGLITVQFGEAGTKFVQILESGISLEQFNAIAQVNPPASQAAAVDGPGIDALKAAMLQVLKDSGTATPGAAGGGDSTLGDLQGEDLWKAQYAQSADLQKEFGEEKRYLAYMKATGSGSAKILRKH